MLAPLPEGFSTLDRVLVDAAIATARRGEGALTPSTLKDLVEEVVALNVTRERSSFHRGFAAAVLMEDLRSGEPDPERFAWELSGFVFGAHLMGQRANVARALLAHGDAAERLAAGESGASAIAAPIILRDADQARALREHGDFERASATIAEALSSEAPPWLRARLLTDLGLCRARLRRLADARLPPDRARWVAFAAAVGAGERSFHEATALGARAGGAELCLGVLALARGQPANARPHLDRALALGCDGRPSDGAALIGRARLYRLLAGGSPDAEGDLAAALEAVPSEVPPILGDILLELAVGDAATVAAIAGAAHQVLGDAVVDVARESGLLDKLAPLRAALLQRAAVEGRPAGQRFESARQVLVAARDANDLDQAREAFDVLEDLASRTGVERAAFLALASDLEAWESVWAPHEARFAMVPLLVQEGRSADAAELLIAGARDLVVRGDENSIEMAREALEQAHLWGADVPLDLKRVVAAPPPLAPLARKPHGRVLLIGGNETQQQYAAFLQDHVRTNWPGVTLDIEFPGWSSNWGRELPRFESKIQTAGAVVLLKFIRTLFGHRMRALCSRYGRPWVPCTGHGRDSIQRAVDRAVLLLAS